jgi:hypothetical protein
MLTIAGIETIAGETTYGNRVTRCTAKATYMADHDIEGHLQVLLRMLTSEVWGANVAPDQIPSVLRMDLYSQHRHRAPAVRYGTERDRGVACFTYGALTLWFLGYPDRARTYMQQALTLAQELAHPYTLAHTMNCANMLDLLCGNDGDIAVRAEAVSALSTAHNIPEYAGTATYWRGRVLIRQGLNAEGLAQVQRGVEASRSGGILLTLPGRLLFLAKVYGQVGQPKAGLSVLHEALAIIDKTGEGWREAELHCTKGELLLCAECVRNAESTPAACFQKALDIARRHQPRPPVAKPGQVPGGPAAAIGGIQLVHRRI